MLLYRLMMIAHKLYHPDLIDRYAIYLSKDAVLVLHLARSIIAGQLDEAQEINKVLSNRTITDKIISTYYTKLEHQLTPDHY
jgi:hypothetical protein